MTGNGCAILSLCSIILPRNHYPQLTKSDAQTRVTETLCSRTCFHDQKMSMLNYYIATIGCVWEN